MPVTIDGSNTPTAGGVGYGDGTELAFTSAGSAGQVLQSNGAGAPTWAAVPTVNLATGVTGTLPIANGGTGTTSTTFVNLASNVTGTLPVANGGTGASSLTANNVLLGNGTSAVQAVAPGTAGNVLTSNGTTWTSAAAAGGNLQNVSYSSSGSFVVPTGVTKVFVEVIGGGGGAAVASGAAGGGGGFAAGILTVTPGATITVTVGSGGTGNQPYGSTGQTGGTSSFSTMSANGGTGAGASGSGNGGSASGGSMYNLTGIPGQPWTGNSIPGMAGYIVSSNQNPRGPGAGGWSSGNSFGTSGSSGQVNIWYVGS